MFVDVMIMLSLCTQCMCVATKWVWSSVLFSVSVIIYNRTEYECRNNVGLVFSFLFFISYVIQPHTECVSQQSGFGL